MVATKSFVNTNKGINLHNLKRHDQLETLHKNKTLKDMIWTDLHDFGSQYIHQLTVHYKLIRTLFSPSVNLNIHRQMQTTQKVSNWGSFCSRLPYTSYRLPLTSVLTWSFHSLAHIPKAKHALSYTGKSFIVGNITGYYHRLGKFSCWNSFVVKKI